MSRTLMSNIEQRWTVSNPANAAAVEEQARENGSPAFKAWLEAYRKRLDEANRKKELGTLINAD